MTNVGGTISKVVAFSLIKYGKYLTSNVWSVDFKWRPRFGDTTRVLQRHKRTVGGLSPSSLKLGTIVDSTI